MPRELFANPLTDGTHSAWLDVAETVGAILRDDIVAREAANEPPHYAIELLREHDLLNLVIPTEFGGAGEQWSTAAEVARIIARTDGGIAHALGYHYTWTWFVSRYNTATGNEIMRASAAKQQFWASIGSAFGGSGSIRATAETDAAGFTLEAKRGFATGAPLADMLFTQTVSADDGLLYLSAVDTNLDGVESATDWDVVGQRLSSSTGITLTNVRIGAESVVTTLPAPGTYPAPLQSLMIPAFQLLFAYLNVGIAEGALLEAKDYVLANGRPWVHSIAEASQDDVFIQNLFGEHAAKVVGSLDQARAAGEVLTALFDGRIEITPESRGQTAELIAAAKVVSHRAGLDATSAIFDATGARSSGTSYGLDRFWRNIRTITLHDPVAYKYNELGDYVLNGTLPSPSVYR
jgi:alkylation response protein AidB-like acyl-CoA dehydrogenase